MAVEPSAWVTTPVYLKRPGNSERVYRALCDVLAGQKPDWGSFREEDWKLLALMSRPGNEGVGPLLYWMFNEDRWPAEVPGHIRETLQWMYYQTLAQNTLILEQRSRILEGFSHRKISALVLKGSAHLDRLYPDIGLRPMGDLDLLVRQNQIERARGILAGLDYQEEKPELWPGINQESGYHLTMSYREMPSQQINVELHWNLMGGRRAPPANWFWRNKSPMQAAQGGTVDTLNPTASLLFGAAHLGYKHAGRRERLIWFYDLHMLMTGLGSEIDWDLLLEKAIEFEWVTGIYYTLNGVIARFGTLEVLPNEEAWAENAELAAYERFVRSSYSPQTAGLSRLGLLNFRDKLKRSLALFFPSPAYMRWRYQPQPGWTWPLYYPVRGWKWLSKNLGRRRQTGRRPSADANRIFSGPLQAPKLYSRLSGKADEVYLGLCLALSGDETDWNRFSDDDWNLFILMVQPFNEGVGPLLYWKFEQQGWPEAMPVPVQKALKKMYYQTFAQNTLIIAQRERILAAFNQREIPVLVLKGPAFIESLYPDIGLRPMGDLDLLVGPEHLDAAGQLMLDLGFKKERPDIRPGVFHNNGFQLVIPSENGPDQKLNVEIHWRLLNGKTGPDMAWFWQNQAILGVNGRQMVGLNSLASFLYGAAHLGYKHYGRRERLIWYYDLFLMHEQLSNGLNWWAVLDKARQFGWVTGVYYALKGVQTRFSVQEMLPNQVEWENQSDFAAYRRFLKRSYSPAGIFFNRLSFFGLYGALRLGASWVFPSGDYMRWRYKPRPAWIWPLYYPYRWLKWLLSVFRSV